jgi:hypothetical protein
MAIQSFMIPYVGRMDYRNCVIFPVEPQQAQRFPSFQFDLAQIRRVRSSDSIVQVSFSPEAVSSVAEEGEMVVSVKGTFMADSVMILKEVVTYLDDLCINTETHVWVLYDNEDVNTIWNAVQPLLVAQ